MKKFLAFLLSLTMVFAMAAVAFAEGETYLWDNFDDRDPNAKPELAPNGVHLWWDNWANLRAKNEDGALKLDMRPKAYDPEDYDSEDDYYAHAADWMANWGEAVDMWGLDGVSYCKDLTIRIKGAEGGEENKLIITGIRKTPSSTRRASLTLCWRTARTRSSPPNGRISSSTLKRPASRA